MRNFLFLFTLTLVSFQLAAQYHWEAEPNDNFEFAQVVTPNSTDYNVSGSIDYDWENQEIFDTDVYRLDLKKYFPNKGIGNYKLSLRLTNSSEWDSDETVIVEIYNKTQAAGLLLSAEIPVPSWTYSLETELDLCGQDLDTVYVSLRSENHYWINYSFKFSVDPVYGDYHPEFMTNSREMAPVLTEPLFEKHNFAIGYNYVDPDISYPDNVDYYRINLLPSSFDADFEIIARNLTCQNNKYLAYELYKNEEESPFKSDWVGNTTNFCLTGVMSSSVSLSDGNFSEGDYLIIRLYTNGIFGYDFVLNSTETPDESYDDREDNCCHFNAIALEEGIYTTGKIGDYVIDNSNYDPYVVIDREDTYRVITSSPSVVNFIVEATNIDCDAPDVYLKYELFDKHGNSLFNNTPRNLLDWAALSSPCQTTLIDTIRFAVNMDTVLVQLTTGKGLIIITRQNFEAATQSDGTFINYKLKYETIYQTDLIDPEPNYSSGLAVPITAGQIAKGNLNFLETNVEDNYDYYKITVDEVTDATFSLTMKFLDNNRNYSTNSPVSFFSQGDRITYFIPETYGGVLKRDSVYTRTFQVCGLQPGDNYFTIYGGFNALEYELSYQVTNTVNWPADSLSSNVQTTGSFIEENVEYTGLLGYKELFNFVQDQYDYYSISWPESGTLRVNLEIKNPSCDITSQPFRVSIRNKANTYSQNKIATNNLSPGGFAQVSVDFCGLRGTDTLYLGLYHSGISSDLTTPFLYSFSYEIIDQIPEEYLDNEPNNSFIQAIVVQEGNTKKGSAGYTQDVDYYKFYAGSDQVKIPFEVTNKGCSNDHLTVRAFNSSQIQIASKQLGGNANNTVPGQTKTDVFTFNVAEPDSIYLEINAPNDRAEAMFYTFTLNGSPPSSGFTLTGETTVCFGTSIYQAEGVVVNGDLTYHWSLPDGGGTINGTDGTATVEWTTSGNRRVALYLSNQFGDSETKYLNVIVNNDLPTQTPVVYQSGRKLLTQGVPPGATYQWFRNNTAISQATDSVYIALENGTYTVKYQNNCGAGPESNPVIFTNDAQSQSISFPSLPDVVLTPNAKVKLPATASSGLPVQYVKVSGPGYIQNDTLYLSGSGTLTGVVTIKAIQPGDGNWLSANEVTQTINVLKGNQSISFNAIENQILNNTPIVLFAASDVGLNVSYSIISGHEYVQFAGSSLIKKGTGTVTVRAFQIGNFNYNAAVPVERSFCIGVRHLNAISGESTPCPAVYRYVADRIPGASYTWSLSGGGTLITNADTAWVTWTAASGTYELSVKANSSCDPVFSNEVTKVITISNNAPQVVTGMQPADGILDAGLPLTLSWLPASYAVSYDVYIWPSADPEPSVPYAADLNTIAFTIPQNAFTYDTDYSWRVVAKNPCASTPGPIQSFRLRPLPDLQVSNVQLPASANSGQTISVSWQISNVGPGSTQTNESWKDAVFLSTVPNPNFNSVATTPSSWPNPLFPQRPLLMGTKHNVSGLASSEFYTNSLNFTLPVNYEGEFYAHVITDYGNQIGVSPLQVSRNNDTTYSAQTMEVQLTPTPDLRVDQVLTPSTVFSGSTINVTYQVKNYGALTPVPSTWRDSVFISQNPLFNREDCIPLNRPKIAENYYPNAATAIVFVSDTLETNEAYTRSIEVVVPNFIMGSWFIYVKTNAGGILYEGVLTDNNVGQSQLEVLLTPTPKLRIQNILLPLTEASTTQTIGANWEIKNEGFNDQFEKNKGHYIDYLGVCPINCPPYHTVSNSSGKVASICYGSLINDSIGFGSSYWVDKVYLSTNPSLTDLTSAHFVKSYSHGSPNSGLNVKDYYASCGHERYSINTSHVLNPNTVFPVTTNFNIPENLPEGDYYVYIHTNSEKTVYEYPGVPEIKRSALPVTISRPDLTVSSVTAPANTSSGTTITIQYQIVNQGTGSLFNQKRTDQLYISNFPAFDASADLIDSREYTESVLSGDAEEHSFEYTIPHGTSGTKYFYVVTNENLLFQETNHSNNRSTAAGVSVSPATPVDLVVQSVSIPDTVSSLTTAPIVYTVVNQGGGSFSGVWTDRIYVDCDNDIGSSLLIGTKTKFRQISAGQSYTDTISYNLDNTMHGLNSCFADGYFSEAYFFIETNTDNGAYESNNTGNNLYVSPKKIILNPYVDHVVSQVFNVNETVSVGHPIYPKWTIKNLAYRPTNNRYTTNWDAVYLSTDPVLSENDLKIYEFRPIHIVSARDSIITGRSFNVPNIPAGEYYLIVRTNDRQTLSVEWNTGNNFNLLRDANGQPKKITVQESLLPDLTDQILTIDHAVAAGQPLTLVHQVTNNGVGQTFTNSWKTNVWLSTDTEVNSGDLLLRTYNSTGTLLPGQSNDETITGLVPIQTPPGNYYLLVEVNSTKSIIESSYNNNLGVSLLQVYEQPKSDLVVEQIVVPDTVYLGEAITGLQWLVSNNSPNRAQGLSVDGVYLSPSPVFDSTTLLVGSLSRQIQIEPLVSEPFNLNPLVTNVTEGDYYLHVKADIQNHINESDKTNNTGTAPNRIHVRVRELQLGIETHNTLSVNSIYYKLSVPDSLLGSTVSVSLTTSNPLTEINEMYIGGGYIPTAAQHDYKFGTPNYGDQRVIITNVTHNEYYVAIRCVNTNPNTQNITLLAEVMPFAVLSVNNSSGGNIGNVTVRIEGTLFTNDMTAKLQNSGTTITAHSVYNVNSTTLYATFNLLASPLGTYDVVLTKPDESTATLSSGFLVEPANNGGLLTGSGPNTVPGTGNDPGCDPGATSGMNSQLVVELVVPPRAILGAAITIQVNYHNPTNYDIPAQTRVLSSVDGVRFALSKEDVPSGTPFINLELTEPGGPPGIIRAGGRGSVIIYSNAPGSTTFNPVPFNLQ